MYAHRFTLLLVPVLVLLAGAALSAVEVELASGRTLVGEIVKRPASENLHLRVRQGGMVAVIHIDRSDIVGIRSRPSDPDARRVLELEASAKDAHDDPISLWMIAEELLTLGDRLRFRQVARRVIAVEPDHALAREALGFRMHEGSWRTKAEIARAEGLLFFEGRWMSPEEQEALVAERTRLAELAAARRAERAEAAARRADRRAAASTYRFGSTFSVWPRCQRSSCTTYVYGPVVAGPVIRAPVVTTPVLRTPLVLDGSVGSHGTLAAGGRYGAFSLCW